MKIIYLDDHDLLRRSVIGSCINHHSKYIKLVEFSNGDEAMNYILNDIVIGSKIDLFITDINHPGITLPPNINI